MVTDDDKSPHHLAMRPRLAKGPTLRGLIKSRVTLVWRSLRCSWSNPGRADWKTAEREFALQENTRICTYIFDYKIDIKISKLININFKMFILVILLSTFECL